MNPFAIQPTTFDNLTHSSAPGKVESSGSDFMSILKSTIEDVNHKQQVADKALGEIATGEVKDLHQAAIAINKAELSMKVMLEVRNKALNAYKEILKTPM